MTVGDDALTDAEIEERIEYWSDGSDLGRVAPGDYVIALREIKRLRAEVEASRATSLLREVKRLRARVAELEARVDG
jgi:hypothetical protein